MKPFLILLNLSLLASSAFSLTDPNDASALQILYTSLGSPSSLTSWTSSNGDPCGQSWAGVTCSGSSVTEINLNGRGLSGTLSNSYNLANLKSLVLLDLSNNHLSGNLPYSVPPNVQTLNLGSNSFNGSIPWVFSTITSLVTLQLDNNQFTGSLPDMFTNLGNLSVLDLSFNKISGSLPQSLSDVSSLTSLYLQNNQFSGELNVLANLKLHDLNVENNQFTGWVPASFSSIPDVRYGGNSFSSSPAPPPPPYTPPPPAAKSSQKGATSGTQSSESSNGGGSKSTVNGGAVGGIVVAAIVGIAVAGLIAGYLVRKRRDNVNDEEKMQSTAPVLGSYTPDIQEKEKQEFRANLVPPETVIKPPPSESFKEPLVEKFLGRKTSSRRGKSPISAVAYSVADLQQATNSFSQENLIGSGSLGPVYRAELSNGKLLAIKKIDQSLSASTQKEEEFMDIVSSLSRLRHANLAELVGYCTEHSQRLLVYEYFRRGSLRDTLHSWDDSYRSEFTWNVRVKIALGTARALEYLHEVCQPAVIHHSFKSANILLDEELNPHLADCGFYALLSNSDLQASTVSPNGYSAPEYTMSGVYTWQSNVYSFGVVMLELLTGRKPMDSSRPRAEQSLVRWATPQLHDIDALASMVDPSLNGMYPPKSLSRFADIIALCVQPEMEFRPPMSEVVQSLVRLMQRAALNKRKSGEEQRGAGEP